jgi:ABC-type anion transport system duplicated permease subunit
MNEDDNYTIEDDDELPVEVSERALDAEAASHRMVPVGVLVLGLLFIVASALCQTQQQVFFNDASDKSSRFIVGLAQPLGIVGALLTVAGICVLAWRIHGAVASGGDDAPTAQTAAAPADAPVETPS